MGLLETLVVDFQVHVTDLSNYERKQVLLQATSGNDVVVNVLRDSLLVAYEETSGKLKNKIAIVNLHGFLGRKLIESIKVSVVDFLGNFLLQSCEVKVVSLKLMLLTVIHPSVDAEGTKATTDCVWD